MPPPLPHPTTVPGRAEMLIPGTLAVRILWVLHQFGDVPSLVIDYSEQQARAETKKEPA